MAPLLHHFPAEITTLIFAELPSQDLLPVRRTCKDFHAIATHLFTRHYFQTRHVMFERRSIDTLVDISMHASLARHVTTLEFCPYHLLPLEELEDIDPPFKPYDEIMKRMASGTEDSGARSPQDGRPSRLDPDAYLALWEDQEQMIETHHAFHCLSKAMSNLTHCERITFDDGNRPWGLDRLEETIGILPQRTLTFLSTKSVELIRHVIHAVLSAAVISKLELKDLDINIGSQMENANRISPHMLPILPTHITSLRHLYLILDSDNPILDLVNPEFPTFDPSSWESGLVEFIELFPQLSQFMLEFEYRDDINRFSRFSSLLYIPNLEVLSLGLIDCTGEELADFLLRHRNSLREIYFDTINLISGTESSWHLLIEKISDTLEINHFSMVGCMIEDTYVQDEGPLEATDAQGLADIISKLSRRE
ncbi:hypothetical protein MRS44_013806 [Fusarium solani]|uniref:uncharacterized protein n=1 Tax=Fusarium solani TaxID=169388 RepID=UPI0032C45448|nr:hypothetical protein MRS44_013806 [Fusarium solani]